MNNVIVLPSNDDPSDEDLSLGTSATRTGPAWTEVDYTLAPKMAQFGGIVAIVGKACGIRSDGNAFWAAYDLPWIYPKGFDWTEKAKARLDTFLDCGCSLVTGVCSYHQMMNEAWMKEDELRNNIVAAEIPEALKGHINPANNPRSPRTGPSPWGDKNSLKVVKPS